MSEKAKLIRGDPPKIALKGRLSPPKRKIWPLQKHADFHFEGTILFFQFLGGSPFFLTQFLGDRPVLVLPFH